MFFAKLRKPLISNDFVVKEELITKLSENRNTKVIVVNAPAGYGKSSLISFWLESKKHKYSWFSIESKDDNFRVFLEYLVKALDQNIPGLVKKVDEIIHSNSLPQLEIICQNLLNHLENTPHPFYLILDDFHLIKNAEIHELINCFIKYQPAQIRLVLISRTTPPQILSELFFRNELVQLTQKDLSFSIENLTTILENKSIEGWAKSTIEKLLFHSEGWILGINMILKGKKFESEILEIEHHLDPVYDQERNKFLEEYLKEVDGRLLDFLLLCSIPEQFNEELAYEIGQKILGFSETETSQVLSDLKYFNLFFISIDSESNLFKLHHLFKSFFNKKIRQSFDIDQVKKAYKLISLWYLKNNAIEESIHYALEGGLYEFAADLIIQNRFFEINENRLWKLDFWVKSLPEELRISRPELILSQIPTLIEEFKIQEVIHSIEICERLLEDQQESELFAELAIYKSFLSTWIFSDPEKALNEFAIAKKIYRKNDVFLARYCFYRSVSLFFLGKKEEAIRELEEEILKCGWNMKGQLKKIQIYLELLDAKFLGAKSLAIEKAQTFGDNEGPYQLGWTKYTLGNIFFQLGELEKSNQFFSDLLENKWQILQRLIVDTYSGLAVSYSVNGKNQIAQKYLDDLKSYLKENNLNHFSHFHESTEARVRFHYRDKSILNWAENFGSTFHISEFHFLIESPYLTSLRIKIILGSKNQILSGIKELEILEGKLAKLHVNYHKTDILLIKAIGNYRLGNLIESQGIIISALQEAKSSNQLRAFFEMSEELIQLQGFFTKSEFGKEILSKINNFNQTQRRFPYKFNINNSFSKNSEKLLSITEREMEILNAASKGLRNKEIAELLNVSPETVKSHFKNIFKKLEVNNRIEMLKVVFESN